jgi:glutaredoxin
MSFSELYITDWCAGCHSALEKLKEAKLDFEVVNVTSEQALYRAFAVWEHRLGHNPNTIPQFWYCGEYIGGIKDIDKFLKEKNVN